MATKKAGGKKATAPKAEEAPPAEKASAKAVAKKTTTSKAAEPQSAGTAHHAEQHTKAHQKAQPTHHDIALRAYLLWEQHGKHHGQQDTYWHQAEAELRS